MKTYPVFAVKVKGKNGRYIHVWTALTKTGAIAIGQRLDLPFRVSMLRSSEAYYIAVALNKMQNSF